MPTITNKKLAEYREIARKYTQVIGTHWFKTEVATQKRMQQKILYWRLMAAVYAILLACDAYLHFLNYINH